MSEHLSYPIGKFARPESLTAQEGKEKTSALPNLPRLLIYLSLCLIIFSCKKNKQYDYCKDNPCQYTTMNINGTMYYFNSAYFEKSASSRLVISRIIYPDFPKKSERISFAGIPDTLGLIYLKKGDAWSGYPSVKYYYFEEDVAMDNSAPYDSTSSWLEIFEMDSTHIKGRAQLKLFRSGSDYPSTFYGDVDTLNISFDFNVFK